MRGARGPCVGGWTAGSLMHVEPEHDFAKLEPVAVDQRSFVSGARELVVVHNDWIGSRQVLDPPAPVGIREMRVTAAHGWRGEPNVLGRRSPVASEDQLKRLPRQADETNLGKLRVTRKHFEPARDDLHRLVAGTPEANRLRR